MSLKLNKNFEITKFQSLKILDTGKMNNVLKILYFILHLGKCLFNIKNINVYSNF